MDYGISCKAAENMSQEKETVSITSYVMKLMQSFM